VKEDLLPYYEHELSFLRTMGKEFARSYGKVAGRLLLEPDKCDDPHVERLIEAFALLAGRIHHKIDDEFPEITESLLGVLYPHYLRPIPSLTVAQFEIDPEQAKLTTGHEVPKNSELYTRPTAGMDTGCSFRTCYPVTLWPIEVLDASAAPAATAPAGAPHQELMAVIRIEMRCIGIELHKLELDRLRFFLNGESNTVHNLHELLFNNVASISIRKVGGDLVNREIPLLDGSVQPVGYGRDEGLLPYPDRSFVGYRLLQEYFSFPQKFLFFDLCGIEHVHRLQVGDHFEFLLYLRPFERKQRLQQLIQTVNADTFALGCTPIVNLFERTAEPIRLTHASAEYRVVGDIHRQSATEIYSVDRVTSVSAHKASTREYAPFYSLRHAYADDPAQAYWFSSRRRSERRGDQGTEVYLSLVDLAFNPALPPEESLTLRVTCTNRDLAGELPLAQQFGELSMESGAMVRIRSMLAPTKTIRAPLRRGLQWRLISHLALNYLSIVDGGRESLQEILKLYDFTEDPVIRRQIAGILSVSSQPHIARVISQHGVVFAQGIQVEIEFDEEEYVGTSAFLLASVLERFLGLYNAINSFSQLTVRTRQRKEILKRWEPRSGEQILL